MKKWILKNGEEVKVGDAIAMNVKYVTPIGELETLVPVELTEDIIPVLLEKGIIAEVESPVSPSPHYKDLLYYIERLSKKLEWKLPKTLNYLNVMIGIYPIAVINILLKEIAIEFDKKYKDHISQSPEIYVISTLDGKIHNLDKQVIKSYKNFAAFRTEAEANEALDLIRPFFSSVFSEYDKK